MCTSWCVPLNTIFIFPVNIILIDDIYLKPFEVRMKTFGATRDTWSLLADMFEEPNEILEHNIWFIDKTLGIYVLENPQTSACSSDSNYISLNISFYS